MARFVLSVAGWKHYNTIVTNVDYYLRAMDDSVFSGINVAVITAAGSDSGNDDFEADGFTQPQLCQACRGKPGCSTDEAFRTVWQHCVMAGWFERFHYKKET
jgi:hypothetical protein